MGVSKETCRLTGCDDIQLARRPTFTERLVHCYLDLRSPRIISASRAAEVGCEGRLAQMRLR